MDRIEGKKNKVVLVIIVSLSELSYCYKHNVIGLVRQGLTLVCPQISLRLFEVRKLPASLNLLSRFYVHRELGHA